MRTLKITAADVKNGKYVGKEDVSDFEGHIEIAGGLGWVTFAGFLSASGYISAGAGSGIEAGEGIKAGEGIEAGSGIKAGDGIEAGWGIKAGSGIEAGWGIEAGSGIEAGWGIKAGFSIACKFLSVRLRIFAGLVSWRLPKPDEDEIRGELRNGTIAFGKHVPPAVATEVV